MSHKDHHHHKHKQGEPTGILYESILEKIEERKQKLFKKEDENKGLAQIKNMIQGITSATQSNNPLQKKNTQNLNKLTSIFSQVMGASDPQDQQNNGQSENQIDMDMVYETRTQNFYFKQLTIAEYCCVFFSLVGLSLGMLSYEVKIRMNSLKDEEKKESLRNIYLTANILSTICTIFLLFSIYIRYEIQLKRAISMEVFTQYDSLYNTGLWKWLVWEGFLNILAPYAFFDGLKYQEYVIEYDIWIVYEFNDLLLSASFVRVFFAFRLILYLTIFCNQRSQRICLIHGCEANTMFAIKCLMKERPNRVLIYSLLITTLIFGYELRIFESKLNEISEQNFSNMLNSIWNVIITLTSVGYGDIYPKTFFGRTIGVFICFWGFFIISFFVLTVETLLSFNNNESKAYDILQSLACKQEMKARAVDVLSTAYAMKNVRQSSRPSQMKSVSFKQKMLSSFQDFRTSMLEFQRIVRIVRGQDDSKPQDLMQGVMEDLIESILDLKEKHHLSKDNITDLLKYLKQEMAETGKYQKMKENLRKMRDKITEMEQQRYQRKQNKVDNMHSSSSYEDSSPEGSVENQNNLKNEQPQHRSQKLNDDSDIQPEDDFMNKENAQKYKSGRIYHSSDKHSHRAMTQDQFNMDNSQNFDNQQEGSYPRSDVTEGQLEPSKNKLLKKQNSNSRNSSHKMSNYFSLPQDTKRKKNFD